MNSTVTGSTESTVIESTESTVPPTVTESNEPTVTEPTVTESTVPVSTDSTGTESESTVTEFHTLPWGTWVFERAGCRGDPIPGGTDRHVKTSFHTTASSTRHGHWLFCTFGHLLRWSNFFGLWPWQVLGRCFPTPV